MNNPHEIKIVHSSDLHIVQNGGQSEKEGAQYLERVLATANSLAVDLVLLAGDTFDHNRVSDELIAHAADLLGDSQLPVVILPGNHDPLTEDSVYHRGGVADLENVSVLGLTHQQTIHYEALELEIWGNAHLDYRNMIPLRDPPKRQHRWHIAMAHGHYDDAIDAAQKYRPSWLINDAELAATNADYVALGHWNIAKSVGAQNITAHYSGSPDHAETVNIVELIQPGTVNVSRHSSGDFTIL